jgi:hypothetical protein
MARAQKKKKFPRKVERAEGKGRKRAKKKKEKKKREERGARREGTHKKGPWTSGSGSMWLSIGFRRSELAQATDEMDAREGWVRGWVWELLYLYEIRVGSENTYQTTRPKAPCEGGTRYPEGEK